MFTPTSISLTILFTLLWLVALASHIILLKLLLTPYERVKLRLPAGSWPLLLTLTIADLVALLTALPFTSLFAIFNYWFFGEVLCDMNSYVKVASLTVSSYVILGLLMQSYEMVVKTPRPPMSSVKLGLLIGSICLLAVVTALPMLFTHKVYLVDEHNHRLRENHLETFELHEDRHFPITQDTAMETLATKATRKICAVNYDQDFLFYPKTQYFFLQFAVPLAIVFFLFIKITDTMNKQAGQGKSSKNNTVEMAQQQPGMMQPLQDVKVCDGSLVFTVQLLIIFSFICLVCAYHSHSHRCLLLVLGTSELFHHFSWLEQCLLAVHCRAF